MKFVVKGLRNHFLKTPSMNEFNNTYTIQQLNTSQAKSFLSAVAGEGVFGFEYVLTLDREDYYFFAAPQIKPSLPLSEQDSVIAQLNSYKKEVDCFVIIPTKSSYFPFGFKCKESLIQSINKLQKELGNVGILLQIVLSERKDFWQGSLTERYDDYLSGIDGPSSIKPIRNLQRKVNETFDRYLDWCYKRAEIEEFGQKIKEKGFRFSIRLALFGDDPDKNQRENKQIKLNLIKKIKESFNHYQYMNTWRIATVTSRDEFIRQLKSRRLTGSSTDILCESELIPLLSKRYTESVRTKVKKDSSNNIIEPKYSNGDSREQNFIHILPKGDVNEYEEYEGIGEKFTESLQSLSLLEKDQLIEITHVYHGPTMQKINFSLPKSLKFSKLQNEQTIKDIQTLMAIKKLTIVQGEEAGEVALMLPQKKRAKIFLGDYLDTFEFKSLINESPLAFFVGVNEFGEPIFDCLTRVRHVLVAGATGSGKSVWLNQLILTLLLTRSPNELLFYMVDCKQVELTPYNQFPHVKEVVTDAGKAYKLLKRIVAEMHRRYEVISECGVKNIQLLNKKFPEKRLPYIVVIIDEFSELMMTNKEVEGLVVSLAQLSRASGIHLVIGTQRPEQNVITGLIKANMPGKVVFRMNSRHDYATIFDSKPKVDLLGKGHGALNFEGQMEEHIFFQGALIVDDPNDEDLEGNLIRQLSNMMVGMDNSEVEELPELSVVDDEEKDTTNELLVRLKCEIAKNNETRLSVLRDIMKINKNRLSEMMNGLVNEGWLTKGVSRQDGYKINVSEEELEKWRNVE